MAASSISVDQDQFSCAICLDLLKDAVTINCGHSFCMECINGYWDQDDQTGVYSCPQCRETFTPRPVLRRNNMLAEVLQKLKKIELQPASPAHCYAGPGDVECDFCTGTKLKAIKTCLVCLASYCETHLQPHYELPAFKKHKLVKASTQLQEQICPQHDKLIEIYCRTDQSCICYLCTMDEHKGHDSVSAAAARHDKQTKLKRMQVISRLKIQEKEKKVQELKQDLDTLKRSAQTAVKDSEKIFTELISSIEKKRREVRKLIRDQEKAELSRGEGLLDQLEQEITDLKRRDTELVQLSHTEDHIHFLQRFRSLCDHPVDYDCKVVTVRQHASFDKVSKSIRDLKDKLEDFYEKEVKTVLSKGSRSSSVSSSKSSVLKDYLENKGRVNLVSELKVLPRVHHGVQCDGCQMTPIWGPRFKCLICYNFDFCDTCYHTREHGVNCFRHAFTRIDEPVQCFP